MKLYANQKILSLTTVFDIVDERNDPRYSVRGEFLTIGRRLHVTDRNGREVAFLRQRPFRLLPTFEIYIGDRLAARIIKRFTFFRPSYVIMDCNWTVNGDFLAHDYSMYDGTGSEVASVHKRWLTFGDCFELDVPDKRNEILAVCLMLAIDCVMDQQAAASSNAANSPG